MRTLTLKRETLTELTPDLLRTVAGGSLPAVASLQVKTCVAVVQTLFCASWHTEEC